MVMGQRLQMGVFILFGMCHLLTILQRITTVSRPPLCLFRTISVQPQRFGIKGFLTPQ